MNKLVQTSLTALAVSTMVACSPSDESASPIVANDGVPDIAVDAQNVDQAGVPSTGSNQIQTRGTRSPQGIPDDGPGRREGVRGPRREGRFPQRQMNGNREVRTFDGTSNNVENIEWGASFSNLQRLGQASYSDGFSSMTFTDRAGPREISNTIVSQEAGESIPNSYGTSDFSWQWGQFIDHDLDLTDGAADEPEFIAVPRGDRYFDPQGTGTAVIEFFRALHDPETGTDPSNPRQQENEISSWIDGSMVYGSSEERASALRVGPDSPFLKTSAGNLLPFNTDNLTNANGPVPDPGSLFLAGDIRANEQIGLTAMHTLFVREHNRLAAMMSAANPDARAETIYQAARRLVIAEIQIITYNEHLPALLGPNAIPPYEGYNPNINPTIYNEFSAAAYRLGHSMVNDQLLRIGADGNSIAEGPLTLAQAFFSAPTILRSENDIDPILRGLARQLHQAVDTKVAHTLRNLLFGAPGSGGLDLVALNIQRNRDHGLPTYNDMRIELGLRPVSSFSEIGNDVQLQQSLQDAYGDVSKVDLWIGALAEAPLTDQGSQLGEVLQAIVVKQFTDLRDGDRFWYQNDLDNDELAYVQGVTLAQVIRNNTNIGAELQDDVFYVR